MCKPSFMPTRFARRLSLLSHTALLVPPTMKACSQPAIATSVRRNRCQLLLYCVVTVLLCSCCFVIRFLPSDINCTVLVKSSRDASFILFCLIQVLRATLLGDTGVVFPMQVQLSNTDLASRGILCHTIDDEKSGCAFRCISKFLVTILILLVSEIFLTALSSSDLHGVFTVCRLRFAVILKRQNLKTTTYCHILIKHCLMSSFNLVKLRGVQHRMSN